MIASTANTIALNSNEVTAARAAGLPLADIPHAQKGPFLEFQFRNRQECEEWIEIFGDAFDASLFDSPASREVQVPPPLTYPATYPAPRAPVAEIEPPGFYRALLWSALWSAVIIIGFLFVLRACAR